jgi:hypothetical protein
VAWHREVVDVTEADLAKVPVENIRVPRADFGTVWAAAERHISAEADHGATDWFAGGVVVACRWLAAAIVTDQIGRRELPFSPATERCVPAYEELIEAEYLAAESLDVARPDLVEHRPGWCEGIRATLRWAWRCNGPAPLLGSRASAG